MKSFGLLSAMMLITSACATARSGRTVAQAPIFTTAAPQFLPGALNAETTAELWDLWVMTQPSFCGVFIYVAGAGPAAFLWTMSELTHPVVSMVYDPLLHLVRDTRFEAIMAEYQVWWAELARRFGGTHCRFTG